MNPLKIESNKLLYDAMIGVGGIGTGMFFLLDGNHTLGREESRSGHFIDKNDYCKLHIISHYVKALLGEKFEVIPVGKIGNDDAGKKLIEEMNEVKLSTDYIDTDATRHTLFSFCFLYPDKSGGNMTTDDSACSAVTPEFVSNAAKEFSRYAGKGIALAAPEVDLEARVKLLELATQYNFLRIASFTSGEMKHVVKSSILKKVDVLCINLDEAASAIDKNIEEYETMRLVELTCTEFMRVNPEILISITSGKEGSYLCSRKGISYLPAEAVEVVSTAGAGDAFTAGLIAGLVSGLNPEEAQQLATLTGACSVTSPHTINKELDRAALLEIVNNSNSKYSINVLKLLED